MAIGVVNGHHSAQRIVFEGLGLAAAAQFGWVAVAVVFILVVTVPAVIVTPAVVAVVTAPPPALATIAPVFVIAAAAASWTPITITHCNDGCLRSLRSCFTKY